MDDVFIDLLLFGKRRQLAKLEKVGLRFCRIIDAFVAGKPFQRYTFDMDKRLFSHQSKIKCSNNVI